MQLVEYFMQIFFFFFFFLIIFQEIKNWNIIKYQ